MPREPLSTAARVWWLVGLTFLFLFAIYLVANRDIAPIDDSDLALPAPAFDPDRNPFPDFRNFTLTDEEEDRIRNVTGKPFRDGGETVEEIDPAVIDQLLIDLADELALFERYAAMDQWRNDLEPRFDTSVPYLNPWLRLS
ncbi:MAG: hypothetical protein KDN19_23075, partial [Verrucomicrobiae bacterium]|nr:hypothetical protein [Verrucomicrobiae bacterium]